MNDLERDLADLADQVPLSALRGPDLHDLRRRGRRRRARQVVAGGLAAVVVAATVIGLSAALAQSGPPAAERPTGSPPSPSESSSGLYRPSGLSSRIYPPAASFPAWGLASGCPAPAGHDPVSVASAPQVRAAANTLGADPATDYRRSDRAFWPVLDSRWVTTSTPAPGPRLTAGNTRIGLATQADVASLLRTRCGAAIVAHSLALVSCPHTCTAGSSLNRTSLWLRRHGTWLLWFQQ